MAWINLALMALIAGGVLTLTAGSAPRLWVYARHLARLCFQAAGVTGVSWLLVSLAGNARVASGAAGGQPGGTGANLSLVGSIVTSGGPSLLLLGGAVALGTGAGLAASFLLTWKRNRVFAAVAMAASFAWVFPTFMLAILAQEAQAQIYNLTQVPTSGGYARVSALSVFWASLVLAIRPSIYMFRQARAVLGTEELADHVRAAQARGLSWSRISYRYIFRPVAPAIAAAWLNSFRLMVGVLPLVEFFFAYPGLGYRLLVAVGIHQLNATGVFQPDLAMACAIGLAGLLLLLETLVRLLQQLWDPRLGELRLEV
jgi:ABC-type dipeptide/oligopeptide/nickel transport system permease component